LDTLHWPQIDHQPTVADRLARVVVTAASHRDEQVLLAREPDGDHPIPDLARGVVARVPRAQQLAAETRGEFVDHRIVEASLLPIDRADSLLADEVLLLVTFFREPPVDVPHQLAAPRCP